MAKRAITDSKVRIWLGHLATAGADNSKIEALRHMAKKCTGVHDSSKLCWKSEKKATLQNIAEKDSFVYSERYKA